MAAVSTQSVAGCVLPVGLGLGLALLLVGLALGEGLEVAPVDVV